MLIVTVNICVGILAAVVLASLLHSGRKFFQVFGQLQAEAEAAKTLGELTVTYRDAGIATAPILANSALAPVVLAFAVDKPANAGVAANAACGLDRHNTWAVAQSARAIQTATRRDKAGSRLRAKVRAKVKLVARSYISFAA